MPVGAKGLEYFYHRGLSDELIKKFRLGFAPANNELKAYLKSKGVNEFDMAELGLIAIPEDKDKPSHDFFKNRVMIPIFDKKNRVIAFGGRIMDNGQPKYLNSPETTLFNKRKMLYNLNFARDKGFESKRLIICEGYMDVIALDKFGFSYAAAPMGTALTEDQICEAWKIVNEPVLCFDGDAAGIKAALRSVDRALPILKPGYSLQFLFLPDKQDPDEFLKDKGPDAFEKMLQSQTVPLMQLLWEKNTKDQPSDTPERKALIQKNIKNEVLKITDNEVRAYYAEEMKKRIAEAFGVGKTYSSKPKTKPTNRLLKPVDNIDLRFILASLLLYPQLSDEVEERILMFDLSKFEYHSLLEDLFGVLHETSDKNLINIIDLLKEKDHKKDIESLWELNMLRSQKPDIFHIKKELETHLIGMQIKQLRQDLNEAKLKLNRQEATDSDYEQYLSIQSELNALLKEVDSC